MRNLRDEKGACECTLSLMIGQAPLALTEMVSRDGGDVEDKLYAGSQGEVRGCGPYP